jgi:catechol 2,3-dioxygenase-like lactoylglutathione lyase family enzyme
MTLSPYAATDMSAAVPPGPRPMPPMPPALPRRGELPSEAARRSPVTHLRHVALATPDYDQAVAFYEGIWGLYRVADDGNVAFFGSVGSPEPYIVRVRRAQEKRTDLIAFAARDRLVIDTLAERLGVDGVRLANEPHALDTPGGGYGFRFFDPDGRLIEVSSDVMTKPSRQLEERESIPRKLSHVVIDSPNVASLKEFYERYLALRLSDWLEDRMCFLRSNSDHHCLAIAQRRVSGLNHVSFEMRGLDEYLRGTGRMVRHGHSPLWGPGRHSAGDNVYSYFLGPGGFVVEYTTELEKIPDEDSWMPRRWSASIEYADQWGTAGPGEDLFALAHTSAPETGFWTPAPV